MNSLLKFRFRIFVLVALWVVSATSAFAEKKAIAIVDAGSSGSRLYVYAVNTDGEKPTVDILFTKDLGMKLSDVKTEKDADRFYNSIAIAETEEGQPVELYILATAGMRLETRHADIYKRLEGYDLKGKNYSLVRAMTISGRYEGLYAWIASNYDELSDPKARKSKGILEIGGASLQIAFIPKDTETLNPFDTIEHPAFGVIYSKSYLGGGVNKFSENEHKHEKEVMAGLQKAKEVYGKPDFLFVRGGIFKKYFGNESPEGDMIDYVQKVLNEIGLDKEHIEHSEESWTKGAAYDIVINGLDPEGYDYDKDN